MSCRCNYLQIKLIPSDVRKNSRKTVKSGTFFRQSDRAIVQRYRCGECGGSFSDATMSVCENQKKRQKNSQVFSLLVSGVSQRRCAMLLNINRKTVVRKFLFLGILAAEAIPGRNFLYKKASQVTFDDLETFEHTRCKPLSVILLTEKQSRRILGYRVSQMPARGPLADISRKKYGIRRDDRAEKRNALFGELRDHIQDDATFSSDKSPHYAPTIRKHYPKAKHKKFKGRKAALIGQGELKKGRSDPLFSINHTFAMLRANINRLFRRTWNTTKKKERLNYHIALYVVFHNEVLLKKKKKSKDKQSLADDLYNALTIAS